MVSAQPVLALLVALLLALLVAPAAAELAFVPVSFFPQGGTFKVAFKQVDMALHAEQPATYPMFRDVVAASGRSTKTRVMDVDALHSMLQSTNPAKGPGLFAADDVDEDAEYPDATPAGFILHESRCGSTLAANMLSVVPGALVYAESSAPSDVITHCSGCSLETQVRYLRLVVAAMARVPGYNRMFFKFQSKCTRFAEVIHLAFPATPWVFMYRNGLEVMVSNMRRSSGPCVRSQSNPPAAVQEAAGMSAAQLRRVGQEQYCAAHLASLRLAVLPLLERPHSTGVAVNYNTMPNAFPEVVRQHFGVPLSDDALQAMLDIASVYSKARTSAAAGVTFQSDVSKKQVAANAAMRRWNDKYLDPLAQRLQPTSLSKASPRSGPDTPTDGPEPPPPDYPQLFPMVDILRAWNPDDVAIPSSYPKHNSLRVFDYQTELDAALLYRDFEVPFVIRNVPNLMQAGDKWTDEYLSSHAAAHSKRTETSVNNHFMYYNAGALRGRKPPTEAVDITYDKWSTRASERDATPTDNKPLFYMRMSGWQKDQSDFITKDLSMFQSPSFFVKTPKYQRGIHCRFGMAGIIAEAHYDGGRNFIAMVKGKKRYVLNPPSQCSHLHMLKSGPSARHASFDWSDPNNIDKLDPATGLDVVIEAGDVLYVPAFWFHYIVSLTKNIQCNTRSGTPPDDVDHIRNCGFNPAVNDAPSLRSQRGHNRHLLATARAAAVRAAEEQDASLLMTRVSAAMHNTASTMTYHAAASRRAAASVLQWDMAVPLGAVCVATVVVAGIALVGRGRRVF